MSCSDGRLLESELGHLNACQARPRRLRWGLLVLLEPLSLHNETCQFLLQARSLRRRSLPSLLLLQAKPDGLVVQSKVGSVGVAIRSSEGRLGRENLAMTRQYGPAVGHSLL